MTSRIDYSNARFFSQAALLDRLDECWYFGVIRFCYLPRLLAQREKYDNLEIAAPAPSDEEVLALNRDIRMANSMLSTFRQHYLPMLLAQPPNSHSYTGMNAAKGWGFGDGTLDNDLDLMDTALALAIRQHFEVEADGGFITGIDWDLCQLLNGTADDLPAHSKLFPWLYTQGGFRHDRFSPLLRMVHDLLPTSVPTAPLQRLSPSPIGRIAWRKPNS